MFNSVYREVFIQKGHNKMFGKKTCSEIFNSVYN